MDNGVWRPVRNRLLDIYALPTKEETNKKQHSHDRERVRRTVSDYVGQTSEERLRWRNVDCGHSGSWLTHRPPRPFQILETPAIGAGHQSCFLWLPVFYPARILRVDYMPFECLSFPPPRFISCIRHYWTEWTMVWLDWRAFGYALSPYEKRQQQQPKINK